MTYDLRKVVSAFDILGDFVDGQPYGSGHINDTFAVTVDQGGTKIRYLLQRVNHRIFKNVPGLMDNIDRVCRHSQKKLAEAECADSSRRALTLIPTRGGECFHQDADGNFWRMYIFIEKATGFDIIETEFQAQEAARAFGEFQNLLTDLPGERLHETIPDFHNTVKRYETFEAALKENSHSRAEAAGDAIDFVLAHKPLASALLDLQAAGKIPERVTHNDTKLNNVLLDDATGEAACVIDLDTLMPGLALYDFGDLVRTSTSPAAEDERDLSKVTMRMSMFEALVRGYLSSAGKFLNNAEVEALPLAGQVITFECGVRFLTDFLQGDVYFKIKRENHNLDRCLSQFKLVQSMEDQFNEMQECVRKLACGV